MIPSVSSDKHLGNYISTNIADRNIDNIYDLYQRSNWVISDFRVCNSSTLDSLHQTYCMHMYGCELWDLNRNYVKDFKVAWRKIKRRVWKIPYRTHSAIVHNLSYNIDFQIDTRMIKFIHSCLNHSNIVCKSIVLSKLYCIKSTFGSNYKYLSCKYGISQDDWYTNLTLSDPGYFRQLTIRGGALKAPPLRSRKLLCQSSPYHTCEFYQVFLA